MTPDTINGLFELFASAFILFHCAVLYNQKMVRGVSVSSTAFFTFWGFWNMYYYPSLGQLLSYYCGLLVCAANMLWISMMLYYRHKERSDALALLMSKYRITSSQAKEISSNKDLRTYLEAVAASSGHAETTARIVLNQLYTYIRADDLAKTDFRIDPDRLGAVITMLAEKRITANAASAFVDAMWLEAGLTHQ